jgi:hypothetical protein
MADWHSDKSSLAHKSPAVLLSLGRLPLVPIIGGHYCKSPSVFWTNQTLLVQDHHAVHSRLSFPCIICFSRNICLLIYLWFCILRTCASLSSLAFLQANSEADSTWNRTQSLCALWIIWNWFTHELRSSMSPGALRYLLRDDALVENFFTFSVTAPLRSV